MSEFEISGISTTIPFHQALIQNPVFVHGDFTTRFLEEQEAYFESAYEERDLREESFVLAAVLKATSSDQLSNPTQVDNRTSWAARNRYEATTSR